MPKRSSLLIVLTLLVLIASSCRLPNTASNESTANIYSLTEESSLPAVESNYSVGGQENPLITAEPLQLPASIQNLESPPSSKATPTARVFVAREWQIPEGCNAITESEFEIELVALINVQRTEGGLTPLAVEPRLVSAARRHTIDMACNRFFSHTGSDGASPFDRIYAEDYTFSIAGENIYGGEGPHNEPAAALRAWLRSSGHRAVMLHPDFCQIGVAYLFNPNSRYGGYVTAAFGCPD
ncbi:MAG: CAP domain-containing protein [Anaerolineaceae bacterium]|nr:CAP domain-containing protein [Anaerolineaceae bacterium]